MVYVSQKEVKKYSTHVKTVKINEEDPILTTIEVDILDLIQRTYKLFNSESPTKLPKFRNIDFYTFKRQNQYWRPFSTPEKLLLLEKKHRAKPLKKGDSFISRELGILNTFWKELDDNEDFYENEIKWLRKMWFHRLYGYWMFNNGVPTYIPGPHFFYLQAWTLVDGNKPKYRERDRLWYIAQMNALTETRTFAKLDDKGKAIPEPDGSFKMTDLERRVLVGTNNPKSRRVGDTTKAQSFNGEFATRTMDAHIGIQGKDDKNARNVFSRHFSKPFKRLPIYWKPLFKQLDPQGEHYFDSDDPTIGLETRVDFATSADRSNYDGYQLARYHRDEPGKVKYEDVNKAHKVILQCLALGIEIIGFMIYTTTVDEMNRRGGENFLKLAMNSMWDERDSNGWTKSGLINIFFPAYYNLQGFIDKYGMPIIDKPTPEQQKYIKNKIGAKQFLINKRKSLERAGDMEGLNEEKRLYPFTFKECFTPPAGNVYFRTDIIDERINEVEFNPQLMPRSGYFDWVNGPFSTVRWIDDPNGHFWNSYVLEENQTNKFVKIKDIYYPSNPEKGVIGADAFRVERTEGGKMSDGGIAAFLRHDPLIDPHDVEVKKWITNRFILTYRYRPETTELYAMDVLMAALYYGFLVYPESNVDVIDKRFKEWGYGGLLLYDFNPKTKKKKENPGFYTQDNVKTKLFNLLRTYIALHGRRDRHPDLLREILDIPSKEAMTKYDLFTAAGGALLGVESQYIALLKNMSKNEKYPTGNWLRKRAYN